MATVPRTLEISSFDAYLSKGSNPIEYASTDVESRVERMKRFPFAVMLKVSYPELDFASRRCWNSFGPCDGTCVQSHSEYRVCFNDSSHSHLGTWASHWFEKTTYDFGFNEWYFASSEDRDLFLAALGEINWGENYAA